MATMKLKGPGLNDWFAEQIVKEHGADEARARTCGPMREAVERVIQKTEAEARGYWCVACGRHLAADEDGVIVHDDVPHPESMTFDEEERPQ